MVVEIGVEGFESYMKTVEENKGKVVFALFCGSVGADGKNWCSDCDKAAPVVTSNLKYAPKDSVLIHCGVGDSKSWKNMSNDFRQHPKLKLKSVPTLIKVGKPQKLGDKECADHNLVKMLFEEE